MINFTNNKKLNIKINILLAAFLEDEFYDIEVCFDEINKSLQENIGIWTYVHKTDDGYYHPAIAVDSNNVIEAAIKNSDIDIEKLCESLNL